MNDTSTRRASTPFCRPLTLGRAALLGLALSLGACSKQPETQTPARPGPAQKDTTPPAAPTELTAGGAEQGIALDWADSTESDLAGYQVSRGEGARGPFTPLTPQLLTTSAFQDTAAPVGVMSYYQVTALDQSGNASSPATVSALRPAPTVTPAPADNTFSYAPIKDQPFDVSEAQGEAVNGKLYTFGGFDSLKSTFTPTDRAYVYDPALGTWTSIKEMPGKGATHAGMTTDGTSIYYAGGYVADAAWKGQIFGTQAVWRYDIANDAYTPLPDLPAERAAGQLEFLNGKLHYFGGTNIARTQDVGDHYVLDLVGNATGWATAAPLPNPRHHMGSVVLNGKIYAVGGQHGHDDKLITQADLDVYDPATDHWTALKPLPQGPGHSGARGHISNSTFVLGGRVVVAGGETSYGQTIADVTAYDPAANTWAELTPLPTPRFSGVAASVGNGFVFTGGSYDKKGWRAVPKP